MAQVGHLCVILSPKEPMFEKAFKDSNKILKILLNTIMLHDSILHNFYATQSPCPGPMSQKPKRDRIAPSPQQVIEATMAIPYLAGYTFYITYTLTSIRNYWVYKRLHAVILQTTPG